MSGDYDFLKLLPPMSLTAVSVLDAIQVESWNRCQETLASNGGRMLPRWRPPVGFLDRASASRLRMAAFVDRASIHGLVAVIVF